MIASVRGAREWIKQGAWRPLFFDKGWLNMTWPSLVSRKASNERPEPVYTQLSPSGLRLPLDTVTADKPSQSLIIQCGRRQIVVPRSRGQRELALGSEHLRELACPRIRLQLQRQTSGLRIGPVFGVYALQFPGNKPFGPQTALFRDVAMLCRRYGALCVILTPGSLDPASMSVNGYRMTEAGVWRRERLPWPDYVWRRVTVRPPEMESILQDDERCCAALSMNGTLLRAQSEKWRLYQELQQDPALPPHLPRTRLIGAADDIRAVLESYRDMYVKPTRGTQGQRIVRIRHDGTTVYQQPVRGKSVRLGADDRAVAALRRYWAARLHRHAGRYIAQETVDVMRLKTGHPFDVRFLIQAVADAKPVCTATVIKVGDGEAITTNLHTGGQAYLPEALEPYLRKRDLTLFREGLQAGANLAQTAFVTLAKRRPELVEIGADVAVDRKGRPWLLEVNPCPGRRMLRDVDSGLRHLSLVRVVEYAVFCTGFSCSQPARKGEDI